MSQNIIEYLREQAVTAIMNMPSVKMAWPTWNAKLKTYLQPMTGQKLYDIGDHLRDVFYTTKMPRNQGGVSSSGACWEALVCWYLNICLVNRRTVVIRHNKKLIPQCIANAITVNYGTFPSNTESDLIAITFPDKPDYSMDKDSITIYDSSNSFVPTKKTKRSKYNLLEILDALCNRDFNDLEIHIIQCKTNWNDNAQIPMLWDAVYSASNFKSGVSVGRSGHSVTDVSRFTYSFVTVPTVNPSKITKNSTQVSRVRNLTGGNYWGMESRASIADSVKEMLDRNLKSGYSVNHLSTISSALPNLTTTFSYFKL